MTSSSSNQSLVQPLLPGPLDIVGDLHGELDALSDLLTRLGYRDGQHPRGRRLVFVGDLCDRGPNSPGVVRLVQQLVARGLAQCVLGNHELNILRGERKHGNHWFYGDADPKHAEAFGEAALATPEEARGILAFFSALPVVLERSDLRIVHAAWIDDAVHELRGHRLPVLSVYAHYDHHATTSDHGQRILAARNAELAVHDGALRNLAITPPPLRSIAAYDEHSQVTNPVRVATSGVERATEQPFLAAGKWRFVERQRWWHYYRDPVPVVFGHYWRWWDQAHHDELSKGEANLFKEDMSDGWQRNVDGTEVAFCIDYSVGSRFKQRKQGRSMGFAGRLGALRWPERELVFDA